jgi:malate dehydrogenase (oxaloacetate-decarboxylating)
VSRLFPGALLVFEAIDPENARQILCAHGRGYRVFGDVQGTGAAVLAAIYAGIRVTGIPMKYQTVVAFGAGATGVVIADQLRDAMVADGATEEQARSQIWLVGTPAPPGLTETVDEAAPTILLGTSAVEGAFTREVIEAMCRATSRPLILPVCDRASTAEAAPSDVIAWSDGRALVAAGHDGAAFTIRQAGSFLVGPGLGLGVMVSGASRVTPRMLRAAAAAIAEQADSSRPGASLLPVVRDLRASSAMLAEAVVRATVADGVAVFSPTNPAQVIQDAMWRPGYPDIRSVPARR